MLEEMKVRSKTFQNRLRDGGGGIAVITDESSIAYLTGYWGYLGMEFGRPTMLVISPDAAPILITPLMESEMASRMSWIEDIWPWEDMGPRGWKAVLSECIKGADRPIWVERIDCPASIQFHLGEETGGAELRDVTPILGALRVVKSPAEIAVMKQAGAIAGAMMRAAERSLVEGAAEYESALAVSDAGTRAAAELLKAEGWERFISPLISNLQILQSGRDTSMVHRRASVKRYAKGDPVYFCFCNMAQFKHYRLGFDRMFHISDISEENERVQQAAIDAQQAAIAVMRPGVAAEEVAMAANEVYLSRGYQTSYRTGRSIGVAYLESPELKVGDKTLLKPGMTFAVDGGISVEGGCGGRIGDSVVVTETGIEYITEYPRRILVV